MSKMSDVYNLMKEHGFELIRKGKHMLWRNECGAIVVTSITPSCDRVLKNIERDIRYAVHRSRGNKILTQSSSDSKDR